MGCQQSQLRDKLPKADMVTKKQEKSVERKGSSHLFGLLQEEKIIERKPRAPTLEDLASNGSLHDKYFVSRRVLGSGQFAVVHLAKDHATQQKCAVKVIQIKNTSQERLTLEVEILRKIKGHPNIVGLYDVYVSKKEVQLVMELVSGGELFDHLVENGPYSEAEAVYHMRRIVSAVEYLHRNGIVHRDLKPENLLLTSKDPRYAEVKVADFGLARIWSTEAMQTVCGTWAYCAPEVRNDPYGYGPKVDVWSLGVIMFVLLAAYHPFDPRGGCTEEEMWQYAESANFNFEDEAWNGVSRSAQDLIRKMIVVNPDHRLNIQEVLGHPWLTGSQHPVAPLSPRINLDLKQVRSKYRQKVAGAGKAAWATVAFQALATKGAQKAQQDTSERTELGKEEEEEEEESKDDVPPVASIGIREKQPHPKLDTLETEITMA